MAESGLSLGWANLQSEVGFLIGYGRTSANWSVAQTAEIASYVQSGIRRVYYPPAVQGIPPDMVGYEWTWLRPTTTLAVVSGTSDYDLPDDLGRITGVLQYPAAEYRAPLQQVSIGKLLALRAATALTGPPCYFATRVKAEDRTTGSRFEVLLYPEPDDDWTMSYEYEAYSGALSDAYPYPLGGMKLSELYLESCLAIAEQRAREEYGIHTQNFQSLLIDAISRDRKNGAVQYGQMGDCQEEGVEFRRGYTGTVYGITYNGTTL